MSEALTALALIFTGVIFLMGWRSGSKHGDSKGYARGFAEGKETGASIGYQDGVVDGKQEYLERLLSAKDSQCWEAARFVLIDDIAESKTAALTKKTTK